MSQATATVNKSDFSGKTVVDLANIDRSKLDQDSLNALNAVMAEKLIKICKGGVVADPVSGQVFLCGEYLGTVKGQVKKDILPRQWKLGVGETVLTDKQVDDGAQVLEERVVAICRFAMAGKEGNGVHIAAQQGKGIRALANAAAVVNSKTA